MGDWGQGWDDPSNDAPAASSSRGWDAPSNDAPAASSSRGWDAPSNDAPAASSSRGWDAPSNDAPAASSRGWDAPSNDAPAASSRGWDAPSNDAPAASSRGWDAPSDDAPAASSRGWAGGDDDDAFRQNRHDDRPPRRQADDSQMAERPPLEHRYDKRSDFSNAFADLRAGDRLVERNPLLEKSLFGDPNEDNVMLTGINFDKYDKIEVSVNGSNVPAPIDSFEVLDVPSVVKQNIELCRYKKPTPIQKNAIPAALAGRDLISCAQTGSGKTAAFLLPIVSSIIDLPAFEAPYGNSGKRKFAPRALILCPTRELALQIFQEAKKFCYTTGLRPVVTYGGRSVRDQMFEMIRGVDILIATPGRLMDFSDRGVMSFAGIRYLVLDEADRMLDMGFEPQIRRLVDEFDMPKVGKRQTLMFSATFPAEIRKLARDFLHDHIFITIGRVGSTTDMITQQLIEIEDYDKPAQLIKILEGVKGLVLVFVQTKRTADRLEDQLSEYGINAVAIHGDRTQNDREFALRQFRAGRSPVLVATDLAARGWDIPNVMYVINYDMPTNIDDYVHRIGRTGRAGNTGTAISFVNSKNSSLTQELKEVLQESRQEVPSFLDNFGGGGQGGKRRGYGGRRDDPRPSRDDFGSSDRFDDDVDKAFEGNQEESNGWDNVAPVEENSSKNDDEGGWGGW